MDGVSWLHYVTDTVNGVNILGGPRCCDIRYIDIKNSRSIVGPEFQYIWRADDDVEHALNVDDLYPNTYDEQQLYDLEADPDQKVNLIADYEFRRGEYPDGVLSSIITFYQSTMRDYLTATCPMEEGECVMPSFTFCTEIKYDHQALSEQICCGDDAVVFPGDFEEPAGYSYSGDEAAFNFDEVTSSSSWEWIKFTLAAVVAAFLCCVVAVIIVCVWRKRKKQRQQSAAAAVEVCGGEGQMEMERQRSVSFIENHINLEQHVHDTKESTLKATKIADQIDVNDDKECVDDNELSESLPGAHRVAGQGAVADAFDL